MHSKIALVWMATASLALSGCFIKEIQGSNSKSANDPEPPAAVNHVPTITGSPPPTVVAGEFYEFMPSASDADGDTLAFTIARKPAWARFDTQTGRLYGTPDAANVGSFTNIAISVSDGQDSASLNAFNITVDAVALGSATLSWNPPTGNVDGTTLTDLSGYRIYYGRNADQLTRTIVINNPGLTRYVVENLATAKWYFTMTSVNSTGVESRRSPTVSKTIS
jgi:Putative Ig domain